MNKFAFILEKFMSGENLLVNVIAEEDIYVYFTADICFESVVLDMWKYLHR